MRRVVIALALGALIWGSAGATAAAPRGSGGKGGVTRATGLLAGKSFTRFVETGSIGVPSSYDERLHLCSGGRFVFDEASNLPGSGQRVARTVGRWRVLSASFRGKRAVARVRGVTSNRAIIVTIATDGRHTMVGGDAVVVGRSDLCR
jgi:hypothetical protein